MPKIVDHEARRIEIAGAALRVIARHGIRGADLRSVAAEAGCSTGVLNHYFADKQALLSGALHYATENVSAQMRNLMTSRDSEFRVLALLEAGMPLDDERAATCRIFYHFAADGLSDPVFRSHLGEYYYWWRAAVTFAIIEDQRRGQFAGADAHELSEILVGIAEGLGVQGIFDPDRMTPDILRRRMSQAIGKWRDRDPGTD